MATFIAKPCRTAAGTLLDCVGSHPSCSQHGILRQCCWWVQILKVIPYSAMQLYSYEVFKRLFSGPKGSLSVQGRLAAGACAGMTATLVRSASLKAGSLSSLPPLLVDSISLESIAGHAPTDVIVHMLTPPCKTPLC